MDNAQTGRYWLIFVGVSLIAAGLLGFVAGNPIASSDPNALFQVNALHNIIHIVTGALALWLSMPANREKLSSGLIGYGVLYAVIAVLLIVDPKMFGLFNDAPANVGDHVLHAAIAVVSIALGMMLRTAGRPMATARR